MISPGITVYTQVADGSEVFILQLLILPRAASLLIRPSGGKDDNLKLLSLAPEGNPSLTSFNAHMNGVSFM